MDIGLFLFGNKNMHFRQYITFHPNNLVHLRLCQHSRGAQVRSICKMWLRPSDIVVPSDILRLF